MEEKKTKVSLKDTNPYLFYKRSYRTLALFEWLSITLPPMIVMLVYIILANAGASGTTALNPIKFPAGMLLSAAACLVIFIKASKKTSADALDNDTIDFSPCFGWGVAALVLWLVYISTFYIIMLCVAEFVGQIAACILRHYKKIAGETMKETKKADIHAEALRRHRVKEDVEPID